MRALLVLLTALALVACATTPQPIPTTDATCEGACARGTALGCTYATPTPNGATCVQVCRNAMWANQPWNLACLASATSCATDECP